MFQGYLSVATKRRRCGLDFETIRSDDIAPYFTVLIVGHLIVPLLLIIEHFALRSRHGRSDARHLPAC